MPHHVSTRDQKVFHAIVIQGTRKSATICQHKEPKIFHTIVAQGTRKFATLYQYKEPESLSQYCSTRNQKVCHNMSAQGTKNSATLLQRKNQKVRHTMSAQETKNLPQHVSKGTRKSVTLYQHKEPESPSCYFSIRNQKICCNMSAKETIKSVTICQHKELRNLYIISPNLRQPLLKVKLYERSVNNFQHTPRRRCSS
jgi:hypothetical protein